MKKTEILSYVAIVLSVIAIVMCSFCCIGCKKGKMRHRGPQVEMVMQGKHMRPDMRHDNRPGEKFRGAEHKGDHMRPNMRHENKAHDGAKQND